MRRELMNLPDPDQIVDKPNKYTTANNDDYVSAESDTQLLLIK